MARSGSCSSVDCWLRDDGGDDFGKRIGKQFDWRIERWIDEQLDRRIGKYSKQSADNLDPLY